MFYPLALPALALIALLAGQATAQDTASDIVEHAIKARCDKPENLNKQKVMVVVMEGTVFLMKNEIPALGEMKFDGPTRFRWDREMAFPDGKKKLTMAVLGSTAWQQMSGMPPQEQSFSEADEFKMEIYGRWVASLLPLRDKALTITKLADAMVGDEAVLVIKGTLRFRPEINFSFSKKSGQLLKIAYKAREQGVEVRKEHLYSEYKTFDGLMLPTKLVDMRQQGGDANTKSGVWTIKEYKFPDKLSEGAFDKPEKK